jgi:hypothetical protein
VVASTFETGKNGNGYCWCFVLPVPGFYPIYAYLPLIAASTTPFCHNQPR